jgi:hypothetical protein
MACHHLDGLFWALKLAEAKRYTVECVSQTSGSEEMYSQNNVVRYDIPARGDRPPVQVFVYDHGDLKPEVMKETEKQHNRQFGEFTLFVGDKGLIGSDARIIPEAKHNEFPAPPPTLPRAHGGPIEDLYHAVKNGTTPCSNFTDSAGPLTAFALSGHLTQFAGVGQRIEWDVEKMECTNRPEINRYVRREYRAGWEL